MEQFRDTAVDLRKFDRAGRASGNEQYVPSSLYVSQRTADAFTHQAFDSIARDGIANPTADRERKAALWSIVAAPDQDQLVIVPRASNAS